MAWVKLDDGFYRQPKIRAAGLDGRSLHLAGACWSAAELTNGEIQKDMIDVLLVDAQVKAATLTKIVRLGLWIDEGDHYLIVDWSELVRSRAEVEKDRARWRRYKRDSTTDHSVDSTVESTGEPPPDTTVDSAHSRPDPTRPVWVSTDDNRSKSGVADPSVVDEAIGLYADHQVVIRRPEQPGRFRAGIVRNLDRERRGELDAYHEQHPDLDAKDLAVLVLGMPAPPPPTVRDEIRGASSRGAAYARSGYPLDELKADIRDLPLDEQRAALDSFKTIAGRAG
jgi:hypothetical protein